MDTISFWNIWGEFGLGMGETDDDLEGQAIALAEYGGLLPPLRVAVAEL